MFRQRCFAVLVVLTLFRSGFSQTEENLRTPKDRAIDVLHIKLDLDVSLKKQQIAGKAVMDFQPNRELSSFKLDAVDLKVLGVRRITADGQAGETLDFESTGQELEVRFDEPLKRNQKTRIEIAYEVTEPRSGLHFFKPTKAEPEVPWMVWSQGEPEANRYWFPCFDRPNERQSTELIARVEKGFRVLSNGKLVSQRAIENGNRVEFHWKQEKPHVSYLVTLVAGEFAVLEETWRGRPVTYYVDPKREKDAKQTFGRTLEMLDFFSERFGIEYPWEKYAQVVVEQFTSGGMENTSATTLYQGVMHDKRALVDSSPDRLIAHELGHQWWGDLVTCRDWSHLWLNEGFATYCEVLWAEHKLGREERDYLLYTKSQSARTGTPEQRPIVDRHYPQARTMFDSRAYPKGGWVLHMLRHKMGDADFFRGLQRYGLEYSFRTAETSDFRKVYEQLYGVSLERFFHDWTQRKGHPKLSIKSTHQADGNLMRIDIEQTQKEEAFHFPLKIALTEAGENGKPVVITPLIDKKEQTFLVPVTSRATQVRIDPDFTLLAEVNEVKSRGLWVAQLTEAESVPERLRAVEHFEKSQTAADRELLATCLKRDKFYAVRAAAAKALGKSKRPEVRIVLAAGLKEEHPKVRRACAEAIGQYVGDKTLAKVLTEKFQQGDESYYVEAAVVEALSKVMDPPPLAVMQAALEKESHRDVIRTKAIAGLARSGDEKSLELLETWTKRGHSRSARMAAIAAVAQALNKHEFPKTREAESLKLLVSYLKEPGPRIRRAAIGALTAVSSLPQNERDQIQSLADHDADASVRVAAAAAIKKFEDAKKTPPDVKKLQAELTQLKEQYKKLQTQIDRLEKASQER